MRSSQIGIQTLREFPADADTLAQAWLVRGGYLVRHAAGIYCMTGLMFRVLRKLSQIIEEEMTRAGGCQVQLPVLQRAELWKETGRWSVYEHQKLMFQVRDRKDALFGLAPTAEEVVCDLARHLARSPSQLPLILFQQNLKFRDELRPRSGLLRAREFVMMDGYSFDIDSDGLDRSYRAMARAYHAAFRRVGLNYIVVQADSGAIGGTSSEEFMAVSAIGEDELLYCEDYAANVERAVSALEPAVLPADGAMEIVATPDRGSIEEVADFLGVSPTATLKSLVFDVVGDDGTDVVVALIRGDCQVNPVKLANHLGAIDVRPSDPDTVERVTGCKPGFIGPVGLPPGVRVVADRSLDGLTSLVCGCCQPDRHAVRARPGRDFVLPAPVDIRAARAGETGPTGKTLQSCKGIEIGHIFKLGQKYSRALGAGVTDSQQDFRHFEMGCYGIGTTRLIAAIVDQNCSEDGGIRWPLAVAPFHVQILPLKSDDAPVMEAARALESALEARGVECLLDDRRGSVGARLKDSDIIGLPFRIVLGRGLKDGVVELFDRRAGTSADMPLADVVDRLAARVREELAEAGRRAAEVFAAAE
ncbi:MAG: proline--tRNA ligase [Telmatospirillum sp.]|nr:proline--tRNA ligase [Telmatospirillum sp.]